MNAGLLVLNVVSSKRLTLLILSICLIIVLLPFGAVLSLTNLTAFNWKEPSVPTQGSVYSGPIDTKNAYDFGYCTYWVAERRIEIGQPIPNNWGDAITWNTNALLAGYHIDHTPTIGSIFQWPQAPGGEGHVAFVESVDPNSGAWTISEMNAQGWNVEDERTYPADTARLYNFMH